jgi:hypothetical protein
MLITGVVVAGGGVGSWGGSLPLEHEESVAANATIAGTAKFLNRLFMVVNI